MLSEKNIKDLTQELQQLESEHIELNSLVEFEVSHIDEVTLQRIKKRKLHIKDRIAEIRSILFPDILA